MKITKKQPLRPRGRSEEKRQSTKNAIRDAYINGPQKEVQIIPAKRDMEAETEKKKLRVCAYCRVSTDEDTQASSYELQVQNYTRMIQENPEWEFAGIFADEGISGTSVLHREHFLEMIEKCKAGEIDLKRKRMFCSDACRMAWWNAHPERVQRKAYYTLTCRHCGKQFESYGNSHRVFCSRDCYLKFRRKETDHE